MDRMSFCGHYESPVGWLRIESDGAAIQSIQFCEQGSQDDNSNGMVAQAIRQLSEYFSGSRTTFDLPLAPQGTAFEQTVWSELAQIPFGETASYLDIANRLKNPNAIRAVGRANGANPIGIVIPCHRIVGSDGSLTGYAGGLWRKRWLLDHEARISGTQLF